MAELKYKPVRHDHDAFLKKAKKRAGFRKAYEAIETEYALVNEMLKARARAGLTQEAVAQRMGTTKSAVSRLESAGKHAPSVASLKNMPKLSAANFKSDLLQIPRENTLIINHA